MTTTKIPWVIKADGTGEEFDPVKLKESLRRAGAPEDVVEKIATKIMSELRDGVRTEKIYHHAFSLLKKERRTLAARYSLKRAVRELGPTGFPFEQYVGEILKEKGYEVATDVIIQGWCVDHEVDVSARKDGMHILIECKFHNEEGFKTDVKVALYVAQRFQDIEKRHATLTDQSERFHEAWLVTNTKLTSQAIQYANCAGLKVIGWDYPTKENLHEMIRETKLQPITVLTTLSTADKRRLMENNIVLCRDIPKNRDVVLNSGIDNKKLERALTEINAIHSVD